MYVCFIPGLGESFDCQTHPVYQDFKEMNFRFGCIVMGLAPNLLRRPNRIQGIVCLLEFYQPPLPFPRVETLVPSNLFFILKLK